MEDERKWCVYCHTSPSGKIYIGITGQKPEERWRKGNGYRQQKYFWRAIQKYGWDNFKHEILFDCLTKKEAEEKEIELIAVYKSNNKRYGYNVQNGGCAPGVMAEETKRKLSKANIGKHNIPRTEQHRQKVKRDGIYAGKNNGFYGKTHSEETKLKMRGPRLSIAGENHPFYGKTLPKSVVAKMRERLIKAPVFCIELNKYYDCAESVIKDKSIHASNVRKALDGIVEFAGRHPETKEKLHWRYATEEEIENAKNSSI